MYITKAVTNVAAFARGDYMEIRARPKGLIFILKIRKRKESAWQQLSQPVYPQE